MLKKIKKIIKNARKIKYQKIIFSKNDFLLREKEVMFILNNKKINTKISQSCNSCSSCNFYSKFLNLKNFIKFYKKFNSNLQLKEEYNIKTFKKKSNKNACFKSYLLFTNLLMKHKKINNIQKLNTILKINDLLLCIYSKKSHSYLTNKFKVSILYEKKLLNKYL
tara:strand:- start:2370 stop:2864 length:495 start_codon:yes stop_codon:yes gene_type:complete